MPPLDDWVRLHHMLEAAQDADKSAAGHTRSDLDKDRVWMRGLVKCIEIIGEAAAHVSEAARKQYPQIPWAQIVAMRNRLVHVYFDVDLDQVWKAVTLDVPLLITGLEKILEDEPKE